MELNKKNVFRMLKSDYNGIINRIKNAIFISSFSLIFFYFVYEINYYLNYY